MQSLSKVFHLPVIIAFLLSSGLGVDALAQQQDSSHVEQVVGAPARSFRPYITPLSLIAAGTITMLDKDADEFFISNYETREERNENFITFSNHLDDYLQHVPSVAMFGLSLGGVEGRHKLSDQAALYVKSELLTLATVYGLKYTVGEARPDTGKKNSFPSGHTAQAFTAASILSKEYGYKSIWISIGAYSAATTVGAFRMLNNRHWISDVLVGAGIGILSTEIVYRTHGHRQVNRVRSGSLKVNSYSAFGANGLSIVYKL